MSLITFEEVKKNPVNLTPYLEYNESINTKEFSEELSSGADPYTPYVYQSNYKKVITFNEHGLGAFAFRNFIIYMSNYYLVNVEKIYDFDLNDNFMKCLNNFDNTDEFKNAFKLLYNTYDLGDDEPYERPINDEKRAYVSLNLLKLVYFIFCINVRCHYEYINKYINALDCAIYENKFDKIQKAVYCIIDDYLDKRIINKNHQKLFELLCK